MRGESKEGRMQSNRGQEGFENFFRIVEEVNEINN